MLEGLSDERSLLQQFERLKSYWWFSHVIRLRCGWECTLTQYIKQLLNSVSMCSFFLPQLIVKVKCYSLSFKKWVIEPKHDIIYGVFIWDMCALTLLAARRCCRVKFGLVTNKRNGTGLTTREGSCLSSARCCLFYCVSNVMPFITCLCGRRRMSVLRK